MNSPRIVTSVIGAGGLLGSAMAARPVQGPRAILTALPWNDPSAAASRIDAAHRFAVASGADILLVSWCAGAGRVGTPANALASETDLLRRVLNDLAMIAQRIPRVIVSYASSGGAVWSGSPCVVFDEHTPTRAWHDYGKEKLAQEALLRDASTATGVSVLISRISNLFGRPPVGHRPTGLVNNLVFNAVRRIPTGIYVPIDTQRDYVSTKTAAAIMEEQAMSLTGSPPGTVKVQVVAAGTSYTIGALASTLARVLGRHVPLSTGYSASASQQPRILAFRSCTIDLTRRSEHIAHDLQELVTAFVTGRWSA